MQLLINLIVGVDRFKWELFLKYFIKLTKIAKVFVENQEEDLFEEGAYKCK